MKHNQPLGIFKQNILFPEEEKAQTQSVASLATSLLSNTFGSRVPLPHRHNKLPPNGPILSVHHCVLLKEDGYFQSQAGAGHSRDAHTSGELCGTDQNTGQRVSSAFFAPAAPAHSPRTSHEPTALRH